MTYKTGSIGEFMAWTKQVIRDPARVGEQPKRWFDSEETAMAAERREVSPEAMVKLLSPKNIALLHTLAVHQPQSVRELAHLTKRKEASVSRTLKKLADAGIVAVVRESHRRLRPILVASKVRLEIDLMAEPERTVTVRSANAPA
jgi:predicted transcriptional regulator